MSDLPDKIWLIKMDEHDTVWCDTPDPSYDIHAEDVTEYRRVDVCEWEDSREGWKTSCGDRTLLAPLKRDAFCRFCGNKMQIKEASDE